MMDKRETIAALLATHEGLLQQAQAHGIDPGEATAFFGAGAIFALARLRDWVKDGQLGEFPEETHADILDAIQQAENLTHFVVDPCDFPEAMALLSTSEEAKS